jgi:hypothetical protein
MLFIRRRYAYSDVTGVLGFKPIREHCYDFGRAGGGLVADMGLIGVIKWPDHRSVPNGLCWHPWYVVVMYLWFHGE